LGNHFALEVLPWPLADAIAGVDGLPTARSLGAQIGVPSLAARASPLRQRLAVTIRALEAAEVRAFAGTRAGDEKRHIRRLRRLWRIRAGTQSERDECGRTKYGQPCDGAHCKSSPVFGSVRAVSRTMGALPRDHGTTPDASEWGCCRTQLRRVHWQVC